MRQRRRITVAAPSVGPLGIAGCVLWLRADLGVTKDGSDKVSTWADQSGNGNHAVQAVGAKQPTWLASGGAAGEPCIAFDGVDDYLRATWTLVQPIHAFLVSKFLRAPATGETLMDGATGNSMRYEEVGTVVGAQTTALITKAATVVAWHTTEIQFNGADGSLVVDGGAATIGNIGTTAANGVCLGLYGNEAAFPSLCRIAEVVLFDNILTVDATARMRAFLAARH